MEPGPPTASRSPGSHDRLGEQVAAFVREVVIPCEPQLGLGQPTEDLRTALQERAAAAGLLAPQVAPEHGGVGLTMLEQCAVFEEAGYSLLGPLALNCAAPDEGNMHLLSVVATEEQQERYLRPLAAGRVRSCFAMTEPAPGAGSDPAALRTTATKVDGGWRIDGRKWLITGAAGAAFAIVMARTGRDGGATMFLVDADNPGFEVVREVATLDHAMIGGHCEVVLEDCRVDDAAVLGEPDAGFRYAQVRLAPARLTHCMRWLGIARRSLDLALERTGDRELFGQPLQELGLAQALIADSVIDIAASRSLIREAARAIDAGGRGSQESSIAKTFVSEAVGRVVDRAVQLCGGAGVTHETPLARFMNEVRAFRIYDGPAETHRWAIARREVRRARRDARPAPARRTGDRLNIVLLGPPGGGKGTQAARLREAYALTHLATGDLLRRHRSDGTDLGRQAARYMTTGRLVPDALVTAMLVAALAETPARGFLLDGFPRTLPQADALHAALRTAGGRLDAVVLLDVPDEVIVERLSGRLTCPHGHVFHERAQAPAKAGVCDHDGEPLRRRDDDEPGTVRRRLEAYRQQTAPLAAYYEERGLLHRLDGALPESEVYRAICDALALRA